MRIAVDGRHLAAGRGVARYTRSLLGALAEQFGADDWRVFVPGREPVDAPLPAIRHRVGSRALFGAAALTGRPRLDRLAGGADVAWAPAPAPLALSPGVPFVLTVHDLSWIARPQDFTPYERLWHRLARTRALAERATRVIAVSSATRDEILARWGLRPDRVVVVHSGPGIGGIPHLDHDRQGRPADPPYFLAVGALEPRKAPGLLVRAHALARGRGLRAELVFAGAGREPAAGPGVRALGAQDDGALRGLYAGALALVHGAVIEGFAFPPIEALAHGVPVIAADLPVLDETVGAGALRVPQGDEEALAEALLAVERDAALRERLVSAGRAAIAGLSWERAARETHAVLAEAAAMR
jgi:glycosyltransferase involved in cell wall biosynthesis